MTPAEGPPRQQLYPHLDGRPSSGMRLPCGWPLRIVPHRSPAGCRPESEAEPEGLWLGALSLCWTADGILGPRRGRNRGVHISVLSQ